MRLTGTENYFEDFVAGDIYEHTRGKTVTEADNTSFTLSSLNTAPAHVNVEYSRQLFIGYPEQLVNGAYIMALAIGLTAQDVSENALADLRLDKIRILTSMFHGDTLYARSTILETRDGGQGDAGVVTYRIDAYKRDQDGEAKEIPVFSGERTILVKRRSAWLDRDANYGAVQKADSIVIS